MSSETAEIDPLAGTVLSGRYRLVRRLGEGGMGAVYLAHHIELDRSVAIKLLLPELARNRTAVERFEREARTASNIGHPNIVDVFDLGRSADGAPYLAMELLEGRDLEAEIAASGGTLEPERLVEILEPIANALDACHARGVIHRDIKPSNIFLATSGHGKECPKLVDFGLAMFHTSDERLTRTGFLAGTPHYLPPEAAQGELAGPAGDIYALAAIAFEALSGKLPFESAIPNGVLVQKVTQEAPRMSERAGRAFSEPLERAVARGLARSPQDRPLDAGAFVRELDEAVRDTPRGEAPTATATPRVLIRRTSHVRQAAVREARPADEGDPEAHPRRRAVWLAVALLAPLLGLATWWALSASERPSAPSTPVAEFEVTDAAPDPAPTQAPLDDSSAAVADAAAPAPAESSEPNPLRPASPVRAEAPSRHDGGSERDTADAERLVRGAGSLLVRGEIGAAIAMLQRARQSDARYAPTYRSLGLAYTRARHFDESRAAYEQYLRLAPGASDADQIRARIRALDEPTPTEP